jgi:Domain of unknown function (DUF4167)
MRKEPLRFTNVDASEGRSFYRITPTASDDFQMTSHGSSPRDPRIDMTTTSEFKATAAQQQRPNMRTPRKPAIRRTKPPGLHSSNTKPQNAQRNYERYLALARAEALSGDRIAAENYFQHAEHYLRSMHESRSTAGTADRS